MRKQPWIFTLIIFIGLMINSAIAYQAKVIYGSDDRLDYYQVQDVSWQAKAQSTVALIRAANVTVQNSVATIRTNPYGQNLGLCPSEPFYTQETAAFCSGFLLTPDTVVTAGHCIRSQDACSSTKFVFGFRLESEGVLPRSVPADQVFNCSRLVHSVAAPAGEDFAVVKLDRAVSGIAPLSYRLQDSITVGSGLTVIGHPAGLPLKVAGGASVRAITPEYLVTNLDTYGGNSGSAVFNSLTGEVEGVLVRGEADYAYQNGCRVSNICAANGCRGEDVTLISRVIPYLN